MAKDYIPQREAELQPYLANQIAKLTPAPEAWGLSAAQVEAFNAAYLAFAAALAASRAPATRTPTVIAAKREGRRRVIAEARRVAAIVRAHPAVSDAMRVQLGLTVRTSRTRRQRPTTAPVLKVLAVQGRRFRGWARGRVESPARPADVDGIAIFTALGPVAPARRDGWTFQGNSGKTRFEVIFPAAEQAATAWVTIAWYNARGPGPNCEPQRVNLPACGEGSITLKQAA